MKDEAKLVRVTDDKTEVVEEDCEIKEILPLEVRQEVIEEICVLKNAFLTSNLEESESMDSLTKTIFKSVEEIDGIEDNKTTEEAKELFGNLEVKEN